MNSKIKFFTLVLMGGLLFSTGCKKDDPTPEITPATINVSLDGSQWTTTNVVSAKDGSNFTFLATKGEESLLITLPALTVDTFLVDGTTSTAGRYTTDLSDPIKTFYAGSGSIEITSIKNNQFQAVFNLNTKSAMGQKKIFTKGYMTNIVIP